MRHLRVAILLAFCMLLLISAVSAQQAATTYVPNLIRYSGTMKDAQGTASVAPTTVGVTFAIYKQQDGGAAVWQETQNVSLDASGQYSVILGSTTSTGLPDDLFSQQEQRWLGIQVQGQEEQARVLLVSVPYAFKAHEAETLGGLPASAFVKAPTSGSVSGNYADGTAVNALGNVGETPGASKGKGGAAKPLVPGPCNPVSGAITYWDSTGALCASSLFQQQTGIYKGYIGINQPNPSAWLDVGGAITTTYHYQITEYPVVSIGFTIPGLITKGNLFLGVGAGTSVVGPPGTLPPPTSGANNTFGGYLAGHSSNPGDENTYLGARAGFLAPGWFRNSFFGSKAGQLSVGQENTFIGAGAGLNNNGAQNTFLGDYAGQSNNGGSFNTFTGINAGGGTITGGNNTFDGAYAGLNSKGGENLESGEGAGANNTGDQNTFAGVGAGQNNQGDGNAFFGYLAGMNNQPAVDDEGKLTANSFLGYKAGMSNTTGFHNTFIGYKAGMNNTTSTFGVNNTFVGFEAGMSNTVSAGNTFVGTKAGRASGAGTGVECCNTYIGNNAGMAAQTLNNTFLGYRAGEISLGHDNTFAGVQVALHHQSGDRNVFLGTLAGWNMVSGNNNTFIGPLAGYNILHDSNIMIGSVGTTADANTIRIGTVGVGDLQGDQDKVFIEPILKNPNTGLTTVVTIDTVSQPGKLGYTTVQTGSGVMGNCTSPSGGTYLTLWAAGMPSMTIGCSFLFQQDTTNFIGIGTTTPSKELDVNGEINARKWYDIGLPETPVLSIGKTVTFTNDNLFVGIGAGENNPANAGGGTDNAFSGFDAGFNTTGIQNTFSGSQAGFNVTTGRGNTFTGYQAGYGNALGSTGGDNTVTGSQSGLNINTGGGNTLTGVSVGQSISDGSNNTCDGTLSCGQITTTSENSCFGKNACSHMRGSTNTVLGAEAGANATTGNFNILVGAWTANNPGAITNDIYIGSDGPPGFGESNTIRIGGGISGMTTPQTDTYIAGIYNSTIGASKVVCVDINGKLGTNHPSGCALSLQEEVKAGLEQLIKEQRREIETLKLQLQEQNATLQLKNASLEERLNKLESYVANQIAASTAHPATTTSANGGVQ